MLRFLTAGESHGRGLMALVESFPAGYDVSADDINRQLERRQRGYGRGGRMQIERDRVTILSGVRGGKSLGSPIACLIDNIDWPNWQHLMAPDSLRPDKWTADERRRGKTSAPRPGHADLAGAVKYFTHDLRNVLERASARETAARVICGSIARQLLSVYNIRVTSHVVAIGKARAGRRKVSFDDIETAADRSPVRCVDPVVSKRMMNEIDEAMQDGDTIGGVFEVRAVNVPIGLGSYAQWSTRLDGLLAGALMSIQSVKGVEIGDGFAAGRRRGSQVHDRIGFDPHEIPGHRKGFIRRTNAAGGIEGGLSNGGEIVIRSACKPLATLRRPLETVDLVTKKRTTAITERSDACVVPAAAVVGEAMMAMVLASAFTDKFGHDSRTDIDAGFAAFLEREL